MLLTVARFEIGLQRREFLTWLYAAIFFFLCFGYIASGGIELVNDRGLVPRDAPWAVAHAMAGVSAFGQLITAMITATAVMRDDALRTRELLYATPLTRRAYLGGRLLGAASAMGLVYLAVPAGLLLGAVAPWSASRGVDLLIAVARPTALLLVPNVAVTATSFFVVGALRQSFMPILLLGLALIAAWQTGLGLVEAGHLWSGALVDPFGNAALAATTREWTDAVRATSPIPFSPMLAVNRLAWMAVAGLAAFTMSRRYRFALTDRSPGPAGTDRTPRGHEGDPLTRGVHIATSPGSLGAASGAPQQQTASGWAAFAVDVRWALRWTAREKGFVTLVALAAANGLLNALGGEAPAIAENIRVHSRVLLIVLVTIYAGELVWRDRELRVDGLRDPVPLADVGHVMGRLAGVTLSLMLVALALALASCVASFVLNHPFVARTGLLVLANVAGFVIQLFLLSCFVHALVQHKVAGHVFLLTGWLLAITVDRTVPLSPLLRFADIRPDWPAERLWWGEAYFFSGAGLASVGAFLLWQRGALDGWRGRLVNARARVSRRLIATVMTLVVIAVFAAGRFG